MTTAQQPEPWVDTETVAQHLGFRIEWVIRRAGRADDPLPSRKIGGHRRYRLTDVDAWFDREATRSEDRERGTVVAIDERRRNR